METSLSPLKNMGLPASCEFRLAPNLSQTRFKVHGPQVCPGFKRSSALSEQAESQFNSSILDLSTMLLQLNHGQALKT